MQLIPLLSGIIGGSAVVLLAVPQDSMLLVGGLVATGVLTIGTLRKTAPGSRTA